MAPIRAAFALGLGLLVGTHAGASAPRLIVEQNVAVSRAPFPQSEVRVASDPSNPGVLLAGSNSSGEGTMRVYASTDGGTSWSSDRLPSEPPAPSDLCIADPAVAIDGDGRQFFSFIEAQPCSRGESGIFFASRANAVSRWRLAKAPVFEPLATGSFDDNPWLAADSSPQSPHFNRLYLAWVRFGESGEIGLLLSHSDDHGQHWSLPVRVNDRGTNDGYPSISTSAAGSVYVAWHDFPQRLIKLDVSTDGGNTFAADRSIRVRVHDWYGCPNGVAIPAQPRRCVRSDPTIIATPKQIFLTYSDIARNSSQDVFVAAFDSRLRLRAGFPRRINRTETHARDQFWPTSAFDFARQRLWVCFYDTRAHRWRTRAWFSCATSKDGRAWSQPVVVASVASDESTRLADSGEFGDYEGLSVNDGLAHPIWTDSRDLGARAEEIYTARVRER